MQPMRKQKREMDEAFAIDVLRKAPYVTVSFTRPDGTPYGIPLSTAMTDERTLYFHCAHEGEKLDCIRHQPIVSLSAVSRCTPTYHDPTATYTLQFRSAVALGRAEIVEDDEEKIRALRAITERFLPHHMEHFEAAIERSLSRTAVVRITLTEPPVGKQKLYGPDNQEVHGNAHPPLAL